MKYTVKEVRDYADACRLAHKGPVIADMLTELAERIKVDESAAPVGFVMEATATRHKFGLLTQDLPPGAELFTHPPAQAAQVDPAKRAIGELLAVIHGDGGHYLARHGVEKAATDALPKVYALMKKAAEQPTQPAQSVDVAKVREVIAYLKKGHRFDAEMADKLETAIKGVA